MPFTPDTFVDGVAGNTPITAAKLNNLEQGVAADDGTNPASAEAMHDAATFVPFWAPGTAYATGQRVVSPNNDVVSAKSAHTSGPAFNPANWNLSSTFAQAANPISLPINPKDAAYGALGDGTTDDTAAFQAALNAAAGREVRVPKSAGPYMINANLSAHIGLTMNQPGTKLVLEQGAVLKVIPNASDNYALVSVTAADCSIEGGTFQGDVSTHTGTTGEWGHLIVVDAGADRCLVRRVVARDAWGDGIILQNGPADVSIENVVCDNNRRQGASITGGIRPRVTNSVFKNTGMTKSTAPSAGLDVEPNPTSGVSVIDCVILGCEFYNNLGGGLLTILANGVTTDVKVAECIADGNGVGTTASGFRAGGSGNGVGRTQFSNCRSINNTSHGFELYSVGTSAVSCSARGNTVNGFEVQGAGTEVLSPHSRENGGHGIHFAATSGGSVLTGGTTTANSQTTTNTSSNVSIDAATNVRFLGHNSYAGGLTNKPKYGYEVNTGAGVRMYGCDVSGAFGTSNYLNAPGATMIPAPGYSKAAAITSPNAAPATYTQTDLATYKTAIDALRTALASVGITS